MSDSDGIHWFQVETLRGSVRQVYLKLSWSVHTILIGIFSKEGLLYIFQASTNKDDRACLKFKWMF